MLKRESRCSGKSPLDFAWAGIPQPAALDPIDAAVRTFESLMKAPADRFWDPHHWAITKGEFRSLLVRACAGRLIPLTHVKEIDRAAGEHVFEIVYETRVIRVDSAGNRYSERVQVRMYISEPPGYPSHFVGLHVHEKEIIPGDHKRENELQNIEIDVAVNYYELGRPSNWGIS